MLLQYVHVHTCTTAHKLHALHVTTETHIQHIQRTHAAPLGRPTPQTYRDVILEVVSGQVKVSE